MPAHAFAAAPEPLPALPWAVGAPLFADDPGAGRVTAIERHAEFVRLTIATSAGTNGLEIAVNDGNTAPNATHHYRVQPAPGAAADAPTIDRVVTMLRVLEAKSNHRPFVGRAGPAPAGGPPLLSIAPDSSWQAPAQVGWVPYVGWLGLNLVALGLALFIAGSGRQRTTGVLMSIVAFCAGFAGFWWLNDTAAWLADDVWWPLFSAMQEGTTGERIEHLAGRGMHAGPNFHALNHLATGGVGFGAVDVAALNSGIWLVAALGFLVFARRRVGLAMGLLLGVLFAGNTVGLHAAFSELPSAWIALYTIAAFIGIDRAADSASKPVRVAAILLLVATTLLCWGTRAEASAIGVVAVAVVGLRGLVGAVAALRRLATAWSVLPGWLRGASWAALVLLAAVVVLPALGRLAPTPCAGDLCYLAIATGTSDLLPSLAWLPGFLVGTALPVGLGVLIVGVMVRALVRPLHLYGLSVAALVMYRVYFIAGHGLTLSNYELFRYATLFLPLFLLLAVDLLGELVRMRYWTGLTGTRQRSLAIVFVASLAVFPQMTSAYVPDWPSTLANNQQLESRTLLAWTHRYPTCAFISVVASENTVVPQNAAAPENTADSRSQLLLFGGVKSGIAPHRFDLSAIDEVRAQAGRAPCSWFYEGVDCAALGGACARFAGDRSPAQSRSWASRRYLADHFARPPANGSVRVGLYPLSAGGGT